MNNKQLNYKKGKAGEAIAGKFLQKQGYEILVFNHKNKMGEIDIVAKDKETFVFVEVKLKSNKHFGEPEEMINSNKLDRIIRAGLMYLIENKIKHEISCRVDAICIIKTDDGEEIRYYKGI